MLKISYKGFVISQNDNYVVTIYRGDEIFARKFLSRKLNEEELKEILETCFRIQTALGLED